MSFPASHWYPPPQPTWSGYQPWPNHPPPNFPPWSPNHHVPPPNQVQCPTTFPSGYLPATSAYNGIPSCITPQSTASNSQSSNAWYGESNLVPPTTPGLSTAPGLPATQHSIPAHMSSAQSVSSTTVSNVSSVTTMTQTKKSETPPRKVLLPDENPADTKWTKTPSSSANSLSSNTEGLVSSVKIAEALQAARKSQLNMLAQCLGIQREPKSHTVRHSPALNNSEVDRILLNARANSLLSSGMKSKMFLHQGDSGISENISERDILRWRAAMTAGLDNTDPLLVSNAASQPAAVVGHQLVNAGLKILSGVALQPTVLPPMPVARPVRILTPVVRPLFSPAIVPHPVSFMRSVSVINDNLLGVSSPASALSNMSARQLKRANRRERKERLGLYSSPAPEKPKRDSVVCFFKNGKMSFTSKGLEKRHARMRAKIRQAITKGVDIEEVDALRREYKAMKEEYYIMIHDAKRRYLEKLDSEGENSEVAQYIVDTLLQKVGYFIRHEVKLKKQEKEGRPYELSDSDNAASLGTNSMIPNDSEGISARAVSNDSGTTIDPCVIAEDKNSMLESSSDCLAPSRRSPSISSSSPEPNTSTNSCDFEFGVASKWGTSGSSEESEMTYEEFVDRSLLMRVPDADDMLAIYTMFDNKYDYLISYNSTSDQKSSPEVSNEEQQYDKLSLKRTSPYDVSQPLVKRPKQESEPTDNIHNGPLELPCSQSVSGPDLNETWVIANHLDEKILGWRDENNN